MFKRNEGTKDISGVRFGRLVVQSAAELRSRNRQVMWNCLCDCGSTSLVRGDGLRSGRVESCGCGQREAAAAIGKLSRQRDLMEAKLHKVFLDYSRNAKKKNREFTMSEEAFLFVVSQPCAYCGAIAPERKTRTGNFYSGNCKIVGSGLFIHGIDRVDNDRGYSEDNCVSCCERCNRAKLDMTVSEFKDMIKAQYHHFANPTPEVSLIGMLERVDELTKFHREAA